MSLKKKKKKKPSAFAINKSSGYSESLNLKQYYNRQGS